MDQPQRAQRFDQMQLAVVEVAEILVPRQHGPQLAPHVVAVARQQHPQILHRGTAAAIVEIDEMRTLHRPAGAPQHIAGMAVAVQANSADCARALVAMPHAFDRLRGDALPGGDQVGRDETVRQQPLARLVAEARDVERRPHAKRRGPAHDVDAPDETADPFERRTILELGSAAAALRIDRIAEARETMQGRATACNRRDDRNLAHRQFGDECVLLADLLIAPPRRTIELDDDRRHRIHAAGALVEPCLVDAILVAVERKQPAVAEKSDGIERIEHAVGREARIRCSRSIVHAGIVRRAAATTAGATRQEFAPPG